MVKTVHSMKNDKAKDITYSITKAGLGSIPVIGAAASELLGILVTPPLEKRREKWMLQIGEKLKELEEKQKINLEELQQNETFIDIVLQTTQLSLKTSEKEKIQLYQNILLNSTLGELPEKSEIQIFLNLIETFTSWHIKILTLFDNPSDWFRKNEKKIPDLMMGSLFSILEVAYPEIKDKQEFCNIIWDDLKRAGLHNTGGLGGMMSSNGLIANRTTDFGKKFLNFIKSNN